MFGNRHLNPQEKGAAGYNWTKIPSGPKVPSRCERAQF